MRTHIEVVLADARAHAANGEDWMAGWKLGRCYGLLEENGTDDEWRAYDEAKAYVVESASHRGITHLVPYRSVTQMVPRRFPVLRQGLTPDERRLRCPYSIPWSVIEPHAAQAQRNHDQTLERLAQRGGLDPRELLAVLNDRHWRDYIGPSFAEAADQLQQLLRERAPDCYCDSPEASAHPCNPGTCPNAS